MHERHRHGHRYHGKPRDLRASDRVERLEVGRVVALSVEGLDIASALDVGTGSGIFAEAFAGLGLEVTAIDVDPEMLLVAAEYVPGAELRKARAEELPFADSSFDLVFLGHVLHETDQPVQVLREARRVARSRVVVLEWPYREEEHGPPLAHRLSRTVVESLAEEAGFAAVESVKLTHMDMYRLGASVTGGVITTSTITCPECGGRSTEAMPTNACLFFYSCPHCGVMLQPRPGDCCVFCSFGDVECPPKQIGDDPGCC